MIPSTRAFLQRIERRNMIFAAFLCVYALLSFYAVIVFLIGSDFGGQTFSTFRNMLDGTVNRPGIYRILLPAIAKGIVYLMPDTGLQGINHMMLLVRDSQLMSIVIHVRHKSMPVSLRDATLLYQSGIFMFLIWSCILGYIYLLYRMAAYFMPQSPAYALLAPVFGLLVFPVVYCCFGYPYDFSMLLLMSACLYSMAREKWLAYAILLTLAILNKETAIYIIFVYALYFCTRKPLLHYLAALAAQLVIYVTITVAIRWYYEGTPDIVTLGIYSSTPKQLGMLFNGYSYTTFISLLFSFWLLTYRWHEKPAFLRCGLWMLLPLAAIFLLLGYPHEFRQFMDIAPIVTLLATHTLVSATRSGQGGKTVLQQ